MHTPEQLALAGLWSVQGIGPVTIAEIEKKVGKLATVLDLPIEDWAPLIDFHGDALERLWAAGTVRNSAEDMLSRAEARQMRVLFSEDAAYPFELKKIATAPPMLFAYGPAEDAPPRRRLAIVGTRAIDVPDRMRVQQIAHEAAEEGICIISGSATGTDQAAHEGALAANGETWTFLGCGLDQIDEGQREIARKIYRAGGTIFSEFPPGARANKNTFKVRNRLISGSSHAVLIFRAPVKSGALHTADYALDQGKRLLATPGDPWSEVARGSNHLIAEGYAVPHFYLRDLVRAVGLDGEMSKPEPIPFNRDALSDLARQVLDRLGVGAADFEALLGSVPAPTAGALSAALVELEVFGAILQKGGRCYEKR